MGDKMYKDYHFAIHEWYCSGFDETCYNEGKCSNCEVAEAIWEIENDSLLDGEEDGE